MLNEEATNTNCIVFGLTGPGFELMVYRTRGEHANHYTTDAVPFELVFLYYMYLYVNVCQFNVPSLFQPKIPCNLMQITCMLGFFFLTNKRSNKGIISI